MPITTRAQKDIDSLRSAKKTPVWGALLAVLLIIATFTFWFLSPVCTSADTFEQPIAPTADLPNFHQVHSYLYRGGAPTPNGLVLLQKMGVKTIIDLRRTPAWLVAESKEAHQLGMNYVSLPTGNFIPTQEHVKTFLAVLNDAAADPKKAPVFVHCSHGSDRTGYLVALWRVNYDRWSIFDAFKEMIKYGFLVHKLGKTGMFS